MDFLSGIPLTELSASSVLIIVIVMILKGKLIPERFYLDQVKISKYWERLSKEDQRMRRELMDSLTQLADSSETTQKLAEEIRKNVPMEGDPDIEECDIDHNDDDEEEEGEIT